MTLKLLMKASVSKGGLDLLEDGVHGSLGVDGITTYNIRLLVDEVVQ